MTDTDATPAEDRPEFVEYYARESELPAAYQRLRAIRDAVVSVLGERLREPSRLSVLDVGCGVGTLSRLWAELGCDVQGLDVNPGLIELAVQRSREAGLAIGFRVGFADSLPWPDSSFDVCLLPELLEHVSDWQGCLAEAARVLRPNGVLYVSSTNRLCPVQNEYELPLYSWYPAFLKRRVEAAARTTHRRWVNFATYPAVNWFTPYELRRFLAARGFDVRDRVDLLAGDARGGLRQRVGLLLRRSRILRFCAHVLTPYTVVIGIRGAPVL